MIVLYAIKVMIAIVLIPMELIGFFTIIVEFEIQFYYSIFYLK